MVCFFCRHRATRVVNSRQHASTSIVWRRRRCESCGGAFTTYETVADNTLPMVESDSPVPFSKPRLTISIYRELTGHNRADTAAAIADTVTNRLLELHLTHLTPPLIAQTTYTAIYAFHKAAGMRYGLRHELIEPGLT